MKSPMKQVSALASVFLFMLLATSCGTTSKPLSALKQEIPQDFKGYKDTLLIVKSQTPGWNKYAEKAFSNQYHGPYLLVKRKELKTTYSDPTRYRFVLDQIAYYDSPSPGASMTPSHHTSDRVNLVDRQTGKEYHSLQASAFGALLKSYAQYLEEIRTK